MQLCENYQTAKAKYGFKVVNMMYKAGIQPRFLYAACRFHIENEIPVNELKWRFDNWVKYVYKDSALTQQQRDVNLLSYEQFIYQIAFRQNFHLAPNSLYNDGKLSIGEFKTFKEADMFPIENQFCLCQNAGMFSKYKSQGYQILIIYDKNKEVGDLTKMMVALVRDGQIFLWDAENNIYGNTTKSGAQVWEYIDSLPDNAQKALMDFTTTNKVQTSQNESKEIATINRIVSEVVSNMLCCDFH